MSFSKDKRTGFSNAGFSWQTCKPRWLVSKCSRTSWDSWDCRFVTVLGDCKALIGGMVKVRLLI